MQIEVMREGKVIKSGKIGMTDEVPNYFQLSFNGPLSITVFSV
jgi:hypothetical protein